MSRKTNRVALLAVSASAILVASLVGPGRAPAQSPAAPARTDEPEVVIKGMIDDDYEAHPKGSAGPAGVTAKSYSPYAARKYPTRAYFGDTHNHTTNSGDAFMAGDRLSPEQAFRFARGEEVVSSTGVPVRLSRPLDFLVVADHAEGLGVITQLYEGNPALTSDPTLAGWNKAMKAGGEEAAKAQGELTKAQAMGTLPAPVKDPKVVVPIMKSVWQQYTATAEKFNEPGRFTAMIGFEWTSVPGGNNLHRNVMFRDGKDKADQILPFSAWQSEDPEKLWAWMDAYEKKTGGKLLAIAHNANLSNGRMFELVDFAGKPLSKDYAERRARFDVLQEIVQTKGASETHPLLAPNDEFANFGTAGWEYGNLTLTDKPLSREMMPTNYTRAGLMRGLEQEGKLGVNPFKFGVVGSTDVHNSLTAIEEDNFFGKMPIQEPSPDRWEHVSKEGFGKTRYTWHYMAAGYAAVWATENTREALWDAMKRKEVYGTSGTRMTVRFFGGYDYTADDAKSRYLAEAGYAKGVPMGGDLAAAQGRQGADVPRGSDEGPGRRQSRPHPGRQGLGRRVRQGAGEDLRRRVVRQPQAGQERQAAAGGRHGRRREGDVDQHDRRSGTRGRVEGPGLQAVAAGVLLRAGDRDPDAALDGVRPAALRREDVEGRSDEAPGARLDLADLVLAVVTAGAAL